LSCDFKYTVFSEQHKSFLEGLPHLQVFTLPAHKWVDAVAPILATEYNKTKNIVNTLFITTKVRSYLISKIKTLLKKDDLGQLTK
jgi:hypothetical protein